MRTVFSEMVVGIVPMKRQNVSELKVPFWEILMFRRLPTFLSLTFAATVGLFALTTVLLGQTSEPPVKPDVIKNTQEESKKRFARLSNDILKLALRWEKSDSPEDKERAKTLRTVLKMMDEKGVDTLFKQLVEGLGNKSNNVSEVQNLIGKDEKLIVALQEILDALQTDDETAKLQKEIGDLKDLIKKVEQIKRDQENVRPRTENPRTDLDKIAKEQNNITKETQDVANKMAGKDPKGDAKNANAKDDKSEPKPESKPGESAPEAKPDTQENKSDNK